MKSLKYVLMGLMVIIVALAGIIAVQAKTHNTSVSGAIKLLTSGSTPATTSTKVPAGRTYNLAAYNAKDAEKSSENYVCPGDVNGDSAVLTKIIASNCSIHLSSGTFYFVDINISSMSNVSIVADNAETVVYTPKTTNIHNNFDCSNSSGIILKGFTVNGNRTNQTSRINAVNLTGARNCTVDLWMRGVLGTYVLETKTSSGNQINNREYPLSKPIDKNMQWWDANTSLLSKLDSNDYTTDNGPGSTVAEDNNIKKSGNSSVKIVSVNGQRAGLRYTASAPIDLTRNRIVAWVYSNDNPENFGTGSNSCSAVVRCPDAANCYVRTWNPQDAQFNGVWRPMDIGFAEGCATIGNPDLTRCSGITFYNRSAAGKTSSVWIDSIYLIKPPAKAYLTFTFDDNFLSTSTIAKPYMDKYGYKGVVGVVQTWMAKPDQSTLAQLHELQDAGWDVVNHSYSHQHPALLTSAELEDEVRITQNWLYAQGFAGARFMIAPYGETAPTMQSITNKYNCITRGQGGNGIVIDNIPPINHVIACGVPTDGSKIAVSLAYIDSLAKRGGWANIVIHEISDTVKEDTTEISSAHFKQLVDYIHSKDNIEVLTWSEIYDKVLFNPPQK